jgi:hypothetical protein
VNCLVQTLYIITLYGIRKHAVRPNRPGLSRFMTPSRISRGQGMKSLGLFSSRIAKLVSQVGFVLGALACSGAAICASAQGTTKGPAGEVVTQAQGSTSAMIEGTITDASGAVVPSASVSLVSEVTNVVTTTTSDSNGRYAFRNIQPGRYEVTVEVRGFQEVREPVTVYVGQSVPLDISLAIGAGPPPERHPNPPPVIVQPPPQQPPALPPPPPEKEHGTFSEPVWNAWIERNTSSPSFRPEPAMQSDTAYSLVLNLAALAYDKYKAASTFSQQSSGSFSQWIAENSGIDSADLEILVIPDSQFFEPQRSNQRLKTFHVNLDAIRQAQKNGFNLDQPPFEYLRLHNGKAPFSFGLQVFQLNTRAVSVTGRGWVAISIWDGEKPIDEISLSYCVLAQRTDTCPAKAPVDYSLRGVDLAGASDYPDAALHLIDRGTDLVGVFRCNVCRHSKYLTWEIEDTSADFASQVKAIVNRLTPPTDNERFAQAGDDLYVLLFPDPTDSNQNVARKALDRFLRNHGATQKADLVPTTFFVRVLPNVPDLILFPMAIMRAPVSSTDKAFVGFEANIETPLEIQDYSKFPVCVSHWSFLVAPAPPMNDANEPQDTYTARQEFQTAASPAVLSCKNCLFDDIGKFTQWLGEGVSSSGDGVVILSEHKENSLYLDSQADNPPAILPEDIRRTFGGPSLAIIDACGTSVPGASEFIRRFNLLGVDSIIGTTAFVDPIVAGRFLGILMNLLRVHSGDPQYSIGQARFEAVLKLSQEKDSSNQTFGPKALVFVLAGNSGVRACVPFQ